MNKVQTWAERDHSLSKKVQELRTMASGMTKPGEEAARERVVRRRARREDYNQGGNSWQKQTR